MISKTLGIRALRTSKLTFYFFCSLFALQFSSSLCYWSSLMAFSVFWPVLSYALSYVRWATFDFWTPSSIFDKENLLFSHFIDPINQTMSFCSHDSCVIFIFKTRLDRSFCSDNRWYILIYHSIVHNQYVFPLSYGIYYMNKKNRIKIAER